MKIKLISLMAVLFLLTITGCNYNPTKQKPVLDQTNNTEEAANKNERLTNDFVKPNNETKKLAALKPEYKDKAEKLNAAEVQKALGIYFELPNGWQIYKTKLWLKGTLEYSIKRNTGAGSEYIMSINALSNDFDYPQVLEGEILVDSAAMCGVTSKNEWQTAEAASVKDFCVNGCNKINDNLAYKFKKTNHGDSGYSGLSLLTGTTKVKNVCFEQNLYDIVADKAAELNTDAWELWKIKDNKYFEELIDKGQISAESKQKIQEFKNFIASIRPL